MAASAAAYFESVSWECWYYCWMYMWGLNYVWLMKDHYTQQRLSLFLLTSFWFVYLINLPPSSFASQSAQFWLNWIEANPLELKKEKKRHLNGIMTAHDIFFDCSCKNFNRMSFPLWFMECFPFCLLFMLYAKIFFVYVKNCISFGSFLTKLLLILMFKTRFQ